MARVVKDRPLLWVASSKRDYLEFPARVQDGFGFELFLVQAGQHPPSAKPLKGLGSGTLELIENFDGDTSGLSIRSNSVTLFMCFMPSRKVQTRQQDATNRCRSDQAPAEDGS
jgi:phage-related protein